MIEAIDMSEFYRCLAETIRWCSLHVSMENPGECLRTSELRPANLHREPDRWGSPEYDWGILEEKRAVVTSVAERRAEMLRSTNDYTDSVPPDLAGGRLLVIGPEDSDQCCLSEPETYGFIDAVDIPAWDTWIMYLEEATTSNRLVSYILCWIPPEFLDLVTMGIQVNPVECFFWATDYKRYDHSTALLRELEDVGLLI